ncbi:DUF7677 family protein [Streptomyces cinerochromogenes]|uniref:DUF7677 family protein n=1 Tax=Streptomyces cinerochromogenes TaxID=66422 RepID=UPI003F53EEE9
MPPTATGRHRSDGQRHAIAACTPPPLPFARGSVGDPMLEGIDYWEELRESPSQMETCFAIFASILEPTSSTGTQCPAMPGQPTWSSVPPP